MLYVTMTAESFQSRAQALLYVSLDDSVDDFMAHHITSHHSHGFSKPAQLSLEMLLVLSRLHYTFRSTPGIS